MHDAETILRAARRPLVIGMGGGGDVVGALATAEHARIYDGAQPRLGGVSWERAVIDPEPGPRSAAEIERARRLADGVLLAGPDTAVRGSGVRFAEARMAEFLGEETVLVDPHAGVPAIAAGLQAAAGELGCDLIVFVDVGGDVIARGDEPGLRSPLCDAILLAAAERLRVRGVPVMLGVFGIGCDAELTPDEVLGRIALVAAAGGLLGMRGLTDAVTERLEAAAESIPTEASAQAVSAFRGACGVVPIRGGRRAVQLSTVAALTVYLDVGATVSAVGRLARAVYDAEDLEAANRGLLALGVGTELELERAGAARP